MNFTLSSMGQDSFQGIGMPPCRLGVPVPGLPGHFLACVCPLLSPLKPCPRLPDVTYVSRPKCYPCLRSVTQVAGLAAPETPAKTTPSVTDGSGPLCYPGSRAVPFLMVEIWLPLPRFECFLPT